MSWICGHHKPTVIADNEPCPKCNPPYTITDEKGRETTVKPGSRGKGFTAEEKAAQKAREFKP